MNRPPPRRPEQTGAVGRSASLRAEGSAIFLTTQYLEEGDELAARVAILDNGRIVAAGTHNDLRHRLGGVELTVTGPQTSRRREASRSQMVGWRR